MSKSPRFPKLRPLDYAVMFGGPIAFLLIAVLGVRSLLGPPPLPSPVALLRDGVVKAGMRESEVLRAAGPPKSVVENEDGGFTYRYQRSAWNPEGKTFTEEDAYVDFTADGTVAGISFDARTPPPSTESR